ncbi:MAG: heparinase II/III family protein [Planctomycetota bacterium]|nr:heparinase II/III family protein [Planctomycetota bacterium]
MTSSPAAHSLIPTAIPAGPRLLATDAQLDRAAAWAHAGSPLHAACLERLLKGTRVDADLVAGRWPAPGEAPAYRSSVFHLERLALAWRLTGDEALYNRALLMLRALAQVYLTFPDRPGGMRVMNDDLAEHTVLQHAARAYDLLASPGISPAKSPALSPADAQLFDDLLRAGVHVLDGEHHRDCGNHNTSGVVFRLALGSALRDLDIIRGAIDGCLDLEGRPRYGLAHHLTHDLLADGVWWERTTGYHCYALYLLCEAAWLLAPLGVDLWHMPLGFTQRDDGQDMHTAYRPAGETRTLKAAFDAALYWSPAGLRLPLVHDAFADSLLCYYEWGPQFEYAFDAYGDPAYAWMIEQAERATPEDRRGGAGVPASLQRPFAEFEFVRFARPSYVGAATSADKACSDATRDNKVCPHFDWRRDATIGLTGVHRAGSTLLPDTGTAVLRSGAGDVPQTGVSLHFGPHAAGHMSPANLHVELFDADRRLTDAPRSRGYEDPLHLTWLRTTIAHNTVTVDGQPMVPCHAGGDSIWEADRWHKVNTAGELVAFEPGPRFSVVRAINRIVYPGVTLDRTLILFGEVLLDLFRVSGAESHRYDWAMHPLGAAARPAGAKAINLGAGLGYRHFRDAALAPSPRHGEGVRLTWSARGGETEGLIVPPPGASVILADDPLEEKPLILGLSGPAESRGGVIVRVEAREALFVSTWRAMSVGAPALRLNVLHGNATGDVTLRLELDGTATTWHAPMKGQVERAS